MITGGVGAVAVAVTIATLFGLERTLARVRRRSRLPRRNAAPHSRTRWRTVWSEPAARTFAVFVFVAMLAYSAQDLILEPFGGIAFGLTAGRDHALAGMQHGGVLVGMIVTAIVGARFGALRLWAAAGCAASSVMFVLALVSPASPAWTRSARSCFCSASPTACSPSVRSDR
jgi:MFS transporter, BCD family, chlorophyll transporter